MSNDMFNGLVMVGALWIIGWAGFIAYVAGQLS
jgi:hypothetical protein